MPLPLHSICNALHVEGQAYKALAVRLGFSRQSTAYPSETMVHDVGACGVQVGVYVGCCGSELHAQWLSDINGITGYEQTGCTLSMFANRLSFTFDFRGPSKAVDTGAPSG